ncbi:MAG: D-glycerate dehydrogenase [bacterium]|nr:D-glycerate dehydrogenase [bacterium]
MKPKVVLTKEYQAEAISQLREAYELIIVEGSDKSLAEVLKEDPDVEAIIPFLSDPIGKEIIDLAPKLKIIANYAVGYNNIDVSYAVSKKIYVTNTPDILTDASADLTMALILAVSRCIVAADGYVRRGEFTGWGANLFLGKALRGTTLGIVGMGRIGLATAQRALSFGMKIIYYSRTRRYDLEEKYGFEYLSFLGLVERADIISPHIPFSPELRHMFNTDVFDRMKRDAIFINVARGDLVDEGYLAEKLEKGELFGAGLDVYEREPVVEERLLGLSNVVLVPHIGSATYRARLGMAQMTIENIKHVFDGKMPPNMIMWNK